MNRKSHEAEVARRLLAAVSIKTLLEILFVCALVSFAAVRTFHPFLRGAIDLANGSRVQGWAVDPSSEQEPVEVQLFVDDVFIAQTRADGERTDLVSAGVTSHPGHGFAFAIDGIKLTPGTHRAQVYVLRRALGGSQILIPISKEPVVFSVE